MVALMYDKYMEKELTMTDFAYRYDFFLDEVERLCVLRGVEMPEVEDIDYHFFSATTEADLLREADRLVF